MAELHAKTALGTMRIHATMDATPPEDQAPGPKQFSRGQRRVLGTLLEKAFTTPDVYPLTLKACTTACNQKNNRDPVTNYTEDQVQVILDELRELGVAAVVHTDGGRAERYRHFMRKRYPFSEVQLAILTELLLRGSQQPGELRTRASRMVSIDSQEGLRTALNELQAAGYVRSSGSLDRRGVEVDHTFYREGEAPAFMIPTDDGDRDSAPSRSAVMASAGGDAAGLAHLMRLQTEMAEELTTLRAKVEELSDQLADLRRALGS